MNFESLEDNNIGIEIGDSFNKEKPPDEKMGIDIGEVKQLNNPLEKKQNEQTNDHEKENANNKEEIEVKDEGDDEKLSTLDESVSATFKRDLYKIIHKIKYVLLPKFSSKKTEELQNWDLWGPLIICLLLCFTLTISHGTKNMDHAFIYVFIFFWVGSFVISLNSQFLGAKIGMCQVCCLMGYCIFPIFIASLIVRLFNKMPIIARLIIVTVALIWSSCSSIGFMSSLVVPQKKMINVYPVFLFFLIICGFVIFY